MSYSDLGRHRRGRGGGWGPPWYPGYYPGYVYPSYASEIFAVSEPTKPTCVPIGEQARLAGKSRPFRCPKGSACPPGTSQAGTFPDGAISCVFPTRGAVSGVLDDLTTMSVTLPGIGSVPVLYLGLGVGAAMLLLRRRKGA